MGAAVLMRIAQGPYNMLRKLGSDVDEGMVASFVIRVDQAMSSMRKVILSDVRVYW